eukprot:g23707.t1
MSKEIETLRSEQMRFQQEAEQLRLKNATLAGGTHAQWPESEDSNLASTRLEPPRQLVGRSMFVFVFGGERVRNHLVILQMPFILKH